MTIVYILLFIVCLSTLIMVHEAGHLATAKIFKVYCFEYAIGFGPKLFSFKKKGGETAFSLRAIPFGGFVSMYGESESLPEGHEPIDESRSLNNIKKWKKCIILVAGVVMNFVLAIVIFFVYEIAFPAHIIHVGHIGVEKGSIAADAGLVNNDYVYCPLLSYKDSSFVFYDDASVITYDDSQTKEVYFGFNYTNLTLKNQKLSSYATAFDRVSLGTLPAEYTPITYDQAINGDYSGEEVILNSLSGYIRDFNSKSKVILITENFLDKRSQAVSIKLNIESDTLKTFTKYVPNGAYITVVGDMVTTDKGNQMVVTGNDFLTSYPLLDNGNALNSKWNGASPNQIDISFYRLDEATNIGRGEQVVINNLDISNGKIPSSIGVSMILESYHQSYGVAVKNTFKDFGRSSTLIVRGLGQLFTKDGFENVGGIIAIGVSTTQVLQENGFGMFLFYWALISVNLGIINLLPFPGLDGWQLLVTIVEGVSRKTIPNKVKNIVSLVGISLLFALMILIIIKDLIAVI